MPPLDPSNSVTARAPDPAPTGEGPAADDVAAAGRPGITVTTRLPFAASGEQAWQTIMFYEQLETRPPLHLRMLLPVPIRTEGRKSEVGDEALCLYEGGHLVKRVTEVDRGRHFGFEVVSQELAVGGGMRLSGGHYTLRELPDGRTEVELATRYTSPKWPRWFWKPVEASVCHMFHRHILRAMRRDAEARRAAVDGARSA